VQELLGQAEVSTTMIYTHVLEVGGMGVRSRLDAHDGAAATVAPIQRPAATDLEEHGLARTWQRREPRPAHAAH
jgi:hypothetical protein